MSTSDAEMHGRRDAIFAQDMGYVVKKEIEELAQEIQKLERSVSILESQMRRSR